MELHIYTVQGKGGAVRLTQLHTIEKGLEVSIRILATFRA